MIVIRPRPALAVMLLVIFTAIGWPRAGAAAGYGTLAECVRNSGAVMYGTSWCPVCKAQRREFRGYANRLKTVECSVGGDRKKTRAECERLQIRSYPTWVFGDGSMAAGLLSANDLATRTGCEAPD
jgi:hypothetical protein